MASQIQVLIVDDDSSSNSENYHVIKKSGFSNQIKIALNGGHALLYLNQIYSNIQENKILVLLDIDMPIMNGLEFLNHLNKYHCSFKDKLTIIMMTTPKTLKEDISIAKNLGVKHFIQKPICCIELKKILKSNSQFQEVA